MSALVVHKARDYFVRVGDDWAGPFRRSELRSAASQWLGIEVRSANELLVNHGRLLRGVKLSYSVPRSTLVDGFLVRRVGRARGLTPEFSPLVGRAIELLGGRHVEQLRRWIGGLPRLGSPCRALILSGAAVDEAETLLAGLGRVFEAGHLLPRSVAPKLRRAVLDSPFVLASDSHPAVREWRKLAKCLLSLVSAREQHLPRHDGVDRIEGCLRIGVVARDPDRFLAEFSPSSRSRVTREADADRILHIGTGRDAVGCWGSADVGVALVEDNVIARHALLLAEHYCEPVDRYWVGSGD